MGPASGILEGHEDRLAFGNEEVTSLGSAASLRIPVYRLLTACWSGLQLLAGLESGEACGGALSWLDARGHHLASEIPPAFAQCPGILQLTQLRLGPCGERDLTFSFSFFLV